MELSEGEAGSYTHLGRYLSSRSIMSSMDLSTQPRARVSAPHSSNMRRIVHAPASAKGLGSRLIAFQSQNGIVAASAMADRKGRIPSVHRTTATHCD